MMDMAMMEYSLFLVDMEHVINDRGFSYQAVT